MIFAILSLLVLILAGYFWFKQYWSRRTAAFRESKSRVPIWFNQGEIVLWNPGQTFAFLKNKRLHDIGDSGGGYRSIYPSRNEEAIGPISLQTALFPWKDENVLTRDGQPLQMSIGVWWKVEDVEKYVFNIYSDQAALRAQGNPYVSANAPIYPSQVAQAQPKSGAARFDSVNLHQIAEHWLRVIVESTVRQRVNQLAVADVVSSQALEFLKMTDESQHQSDVAGRLTIFDTALADALREIQTKSSDFGLLVEKMEVQHVYLPKAIQDAINETRIAFLAPIRGEREAEAQRITLEKLVSVLGRDNVALNQIMSNLKNANIVTPLPVFQPMLDKFNALSNSEQSAPPPPPLPPPER